LKVLLIGDSCEDVYHYGICERISPEAAVPIMKELRTETMPGMSANVLANLRAFGIQVEHITNEHKIEKHRFIDERYNQHLLRYDIGESNLIAPLDINKINFNTSYDAVVISDYNKGFLREAECNELCARFKEVPIFVDTKKNKLTCYHNCVIKINEKEYKNIIQKPNLAEFVTTLGDQGAFYNDTVYHTEPVEVFDVCGAGDVFLSALVYGFLQTNSMIESIKLANKCASLSVSKMGTYVLTKEDIDDLCV
tara:strand:+ start:10976 stop:11731 length:756 start_codon:yes stop_codon:yes gene_type:complete